MSEKQETISDLVAIADSLLAGNWKPSKVKYEALSDLLGYSSRLPNAIAYFEDNILSDYPSTYFQYTCLCNAWQQEQKRISEDAIKKINGYYNQLIVFGDWHYCADFDNKQPDKS